MGIVMERAGFINLQSVQSMQIHWFVDGANTALGVTAIIT